MGKPENRKVFAVSVSGGKDSTAALLYILERYGNRNVDIIPYFSDTGWEHPEVYKYLAYLEEKLGIGIIRLKSAKFDGMKDLVMKIGVPSFSRRVCTVHLKIEPSANFLLSLAGKYDKVVNVTGVRRDESRARSGEGRWKTTFVLKNGERPNSKSKFMKAERIVVYQPIVDWSEYDVKMYIKSMGLKMNPLYEHGFNRVGCYPCIFSGIVDIAIVDDRRLAEIEELENELWDKRGRSGRKPIFLYGVLSKARKDGIISDIENASYVDIAKMARERMAISMGSYDAADAERERMESMTLIRCINHLGKCE